MKLAPILIADLKPRTQAFLLAVSNALGVAPGPAVVHVLDVSADIALHGEPVQAAVASTMVAAGSTFTVGGQA